MKDEQAAGGSSETVFVLGALGGIGGQVYARSLEQGFVTRGFDDARLGSGDGTIRPIDARDLSSLDQLVSDMSTSPGAHDLVVLNCCRIQDRSAHRPRSTSTTRSRRS
jgi:nucleoside-diphosphate-sugar epimerase